MKLPTEPIAPDWEEPHGPHLPDSITRVPWQAWPFIALVVVPVVLGVLRGGSVLLDPVLILGSVATLATVLIGAALFIRYPDAWSRHRPLVIAAVLVAAAAAVQEVSPLLVASLVEPTMLDASDPYFLALSGVGVVSSIVGVFAQGYLWLGLNQARRYEDPPRSRAIAAALLTFTLVLMMISTAW